MTTQRNFSLAAIFLSTVLLAACNSSSSDNNDTDGPGDSSSSDNNDTDGPGDSSSNGSATVDARDWSVVDADQTQTYPLHDVFLVNENTLWAVGNGMPANLGGQGAFILRSTDGGDTWSQYSNDYFESLRGVHFTDPNNGWIVGGLVSGEPPIILRTEDGGASWTEQNHPIADEGTFFDIHFVNATHGWIAGGHNGLSVAESRRYILSTTDGGDSWQQVAFDFGAGLPFLSLSFVDQNNGWAVGRDTEDESNDSYYYTTDGGTNWQTSKTGVYEQIGPFANRFEFVQFVDVNHGFIAGVSRLLKTTDGGLSWNLVFQQGQMNIHDMHFLDANTGWLVGNGIGLNNAKAKLYFTDDGGTTWVEEMVTDLPEGSNDNTALRGVHALNVDRVLAVGNRTTILVRDSE